MSHRVLLLLYVIGFLLAAMLPVEPFNTFGKGQPMPRNVFERLSMAEVGALCGALFGH
jgi:hypothetical protein